MTHNSQLIFDLGMSEGNDTDFYLKKGFSVVGVEADPTMIDHLKTRFLSQIESGRLKIENKAADAVAGRHLQFNVDTSNQGHSSLGNPHNKVAENIKSFNVETTSWKELKDKYGTPYYLKMDIEGAEPSFLEGMAGDDGLPNYISTEMMNFRPIEMFHELGYNRFRIINQVKNTQFPIPNPPKEGVFVDKFETHHWSGLFGKELPGSKSFTFDEIRRIHNMLHELWTYETVTLGWLDCHAWREH